MDGGEEAQELLTRKGQQGRLVDELLSGIRMVVEIRQRVGRERRCRIDTADDDVVGKGQCLIDCEHTPVDFIVRKIG